ncbi:unnamed protein product [Arctogadus glacialis]
MSYSTFLGLLHGSNWRCSSTQLDDHHSLVLTAAGVVFCLADIRLYWEGEADPIFTTSRLVLAYYSTMDELDVPQMKREVESLQYQLAINREKSSITVTELVKWIEGCVCDDPFLNPELMRANPWVEKGKCVIL